MAHDTPVIQRVNPLDDPHWDDRVAALPGASFFHSAAWARVLHETYQFRPVYFVEQQSTGELTALVPFMEVDSWLTGRRGISLPFTDQCEPLSSTPDGLQGAVRAIDAHAAGRRWKYWELRGGKAMLGDAPASVSYFCHQLRLHDDPDALLAGFGKSVRGAVRQAERSELTIELSTSAKAVKAFYTLQGKTRKRHGQPPQPLRFFEKIQQHVLDAGRGCVVLARRDSLPVAGAIFFHFGKSAIYKYAASEKAYTYLRPNNLVLWRAIEHYARQGFVTLDLGRTSRANEGLRRFKLAWGAQERIVEYAQYQRSSRCFVAARDPSSSWYNRVFKLLPVALTRLIGAAAYRHVA